jgi:hypothetical protein
MNAVRAVLLRAFGTPEVLVATEVADPVAEPGQAVIDVEYVNLTFVETQIRAGRPPNPAMRPELPIVPGNGVGGVVGDVGEGVDPALIGTRVITSTGGSGAYAERVAVGADGLVAVLMTSTWPTPSHSSPMAARRCCFSAPPSSRPAMWSSRKPREAASAARRRHSRHLPRPRMDRAGAGGGRNAHRRTAREADNAGLPARRVITATTLRSASTRGVLARLDDRVAVDMSP